MKHDYSQVCVAALVLAASIIHAVPVSAQSELFELSEAPTQSLAPALYEIPGEAGQELAIKVHIWGQVHRPGRYLVPDGTDLVGLISFAGGPTSGAKLKQVRLIHPRGDGEKVDEVNLNDFVDSGDPSLVPTLRPGDVIVIPASRSHSLLKYTGVVSVLALVANVVVTATR